MNKRKYGLKMEILPADFDGPTPVPSGRKTINIRGRKEHEAILKDAKKCEELGLDRAYETMIYLKRWGGWLDGNT